MILPPLQMQPYHPALPTRSKVNDWETKAFLYASNVERQWTWDRGWKNPLGIKSNYTRTGADPGDAEERRATIPRAARLGRAPQDQHGVLAMLNTATRAQKGEKENPGRLKTNE